LAAITISLGLSGAAFSQTPLGHWDFDDSVDGTVALDSSGNDFTGTIENAVYGTDEFRSSFLIFNGTSARVTPIDPNTSEFLKLPVMSETNDFTWALWVNNQIEDSINVGSQRNAIIAGNRKDGMGADFSPPGVRNFIKFTPQTFELRQPETDNTPYEIIPFDTWTHIAAVKTGASMQIYVNGEAAGPANDLTGAFDPTVPAMPFFIGGEPGQGAGEHFNGFIDDVRIYDSALTVEELNAIIGGLLLEPVWDPIVEITTLVNEPVSTTLADFAQDPREGTLSFTTTDDKPEWLTVGEDGILSGTPTGVGPVTFTATATNVDGDSTTTVIIRVEDPNAPRVEAELFGWWPMNDASGDTLQDISGNGLDAAITNSESGGLGEGGSVWFEDPDCGTVISFSGDNASGAFATVAGELPPISPGEGTDFTWSFWARSENDLNFDLALGNRRPADGVNNNTYISFIPQGLDFRAGGARTTLRFSLGEVPNTWVHYTVVKLDNTLSFYRNGVQRGGTVSGANLPSGAQPLFFGGQEFGERWNGQLFDVRLFTEALTPEEVFTVSSLKGDFFVPSEIAPTLRVEAMGDDLVFTWNSSLGKLYNFRSETNLDGPPIEWPIFGDNMDIVATPPLNTLTIARPADPRALFVIEEFDAPPVAVFSDDLESGSANWVTSDNGAGTEWQLGAPSSVGPPAANSGTNCFGTNLDANYTLDANVVLRSIPIDLTAAGGATLGFSYYLNGDPNPDPNAPPFDPAIINVLDAADDSLLAEVEVLGNMNTDDWTLYTKALPEEALNKMIKLEFVFISDGIANAAGWYIDDVTVTVP
jgi:hypothetical protein